MLMLNILSNKEWLALLQPKTILTPHPKELERLIGKWTSEEEKFSKTIAFQTIQCCYCNERRSNIYY
jgi:NAD(P)H-hydrate repair Nnr-like enzyme with NAD(P)H-hydrate dehydratase domain